MTGLREGLRGGDHFLPVPIARAGGQALADVLQHVVLEPARAGAAIRTVTKRKAIRRIPVSLQEVIK